jgi:hypothetical protein
MEDDYTVQIDKALASLAERINFLDSRIDALQTTELPPEVIEMASKAKIVQVYINMGVPYPIALEIVGIPVPPEAMNTAVNEEQTNTVPDDYMVTLRSLQSSIDTMKALFELAIGEETKQTEAQMLVENEEYEKGEYEEHEKETETDPTEYDTEE